MSQRHADQDHSNASTASPTDRPKADKQRAPLINRLIDPSNVVFSLVFCQQTRSEFDTRQPG